MSAHEEDLAVRLSFLDKSRQGQGGVHVPRRAAAGEYDLHIIPRSKMQFRYCAEILKIAGGDMGNTGSG